VAQEERRGRGAPPASLPPPLVPHPHPVLLSNPLRVFYPNKKCSMKMFSVRLFGFSSFSQSALLP